MSSDRSISAAGRLLLALVLAALVALAFMTLENERDRDHERFLRADYRAPAANPPVEPNRPDLFEEPRIDD